jgi:hypothetical protein
MKLVVERTKTMVGRLARWATLFGCITGFALIASGCATPIGVDYVDPRVAYQSLTANVLSAEKPSSFSARELMNRNLYPRFEEDPSKALAELHSDLAPERDEDLIFALPELSFPRRAKRRSILLLGRRRVRLCLSFARTARDTSKAD